VCVAEVTDVDQLAALGVPLAELVDYNEAGYADYQARAG
jgi:hypothetical protein